MKTVLVSWLPVLSGFRRLLAATPPSVAVVELSLRPLVHHCVLLRAADLIPEPIQLLQYTITAQVLKQTSSYTA
jgi:hypothetical protein